MTWQPSAPLSHITARARLNRLIREFFARRDVLEVETPLLCATTATDPHLHSWQCDADGRRYYLQTSPEFCMKRLLAAGCGPIYQLGKAFRREAGGRHHNPEFTLLEWYRPDWTLDQLMTEVEALVLDAAAAFGRELSAFPRFRYGEVCREFLGLDPHRSSRDTLLRLANARINGDFSGLDRDGLLDLLMSHLVEPNLPPAGCFITDFPAGRASLACIEQDRDGNPVARRAELYIAGLEIANGYQELVDAAEQAARFSADLDYRQRQGLDPVPLPRSLIGALQNGFPEAAGVALGVDRLLMVLLGVERIQDILTFPTAQA
ncbi:MAG: EF-P lysine aminoacylase EpmA [Pseudomonadota bacterium]|nr:EF-P lysine aminoacylase EpmA [Pseudomonadota bacterium]